MKKAKFITSIITMLVLVVELGFGVLATTNNNYTSSKIDPYVEDSVEKTEYNSPIYATRNCSHSEPEGNISAETGVSIANYFDVVMNGSTLTDEAIIEDISTGKLTVKTSGDIAYDEKTGNLYLTNISKTIGSVSNSCKVTLSINDDTNATVVVSTTTTVSEWEEVDDIAKNYSATCLKSGWENAKMCSICSKQLREGKEIKPLGHSLLDKETVAPTCTTNGTTKYKCTRDGCDYIIEKEDIPKLGHEFTEDYVIDVEPTCDANGAESKHCTRCPDVSETRTVNATGHSWNNGEITKIATCSEEGITTYTCTICGKERTESIATVDHTWDSGEITAYSDCTHEGITTYTCIVCSQTKTEGIDIDPEKHSFTSAITLKPTCDTVGKKTYTCSRCNYQYSEDIEPNGHTESEAILDISRGEEGYSSKDDNVHICYYKTYCTTCGKTMNTTEEEYAHEFGVIGYPEDDEKGSWSEWVIMTQPTCTTDGLQTRSRDVYDYPTVKCGICSHICSSKNKHFYVQETQSKTIPALNHDFAVDYTVDLAPTCEDTGLKSKHCSRCSQVTDEQVVQALGHSVKEEEVDTSVGTNGYKISDKTKHTCYYKTVCSVCEKVIDTRTQDFEHTISKTEKMSGIENGNWSSWEIVTEAKCLSTGTQTRSRINTNYPIYECSICKYSYANYDEPNNVTETDTQTIPVLGHSYDSEIKVRATCTTDGTKVLTCSRCSDSYEEVISATGHKDGTEIVDIGKGINGFTNLASEGHICYYKTPCSVCGKVLHTRTQTVAHSQTLLGYTEETKYDDWSDWKITVNPTCTTNGSKVHERGTYNYAIYSCSDCKYEYTSDEKHILANDVETETISSLGHDFASEFTVDVNAKCVSDGSKSKHCSRCDAKSEITVIKATGHSLSEKVIDTQKGLNGYEKYNSEFHTCNYKALCANCDYIAYTQENIAHTLSNTGELTNNDYSDWGEWEVIENATCTTAGSHKHTRTKTNYPIYACSLCEYECENKSEPKIETDTKTEVIEPLGHNHIEEITQKVTCVADGITTYTCSRCNDTYTETVKSTGHSWNQGTITKEATCEVEGTKTITCNNCQETKNETIQALGHDWNDGELTVVANCTTEGVLTLTCNRCRNTTQTTFARDPDVHKYESTVSIKPTCTAEGEEKFTCSRCQNSYTAPIPATGHSWNEATITTKPTCEKTGVREYTCSTCGQEITETIEALGHTYDNGKITTEANCTTDGIKTYTCTTCKGTKTENLGKDFAKHDYVRTVTVEPTCTTDGEEKFTCSRCGKYYTDVIQKNGHKEGTETVDVGKGIQGYEDLGNGQHKCYYRTPCSVCDATLSERDQNFDHELEITSYTEQTQTSDWSAWSTTKVATCTEVGIETRIKKVWNNPIYTCKYCSHTQSSDEQHYLDDQTETKEIKATGHDYKYNITLQAKCEEKGSQTITCSRCEYNSVEEIPALGHKWNDGKITTVANCTTHGIKTFTCSVCEKTRKETLDIDENNHDYQSKVTLAPTCTEQGIRTYTCSRCEHSYTEDIPMLKHTNGDEIVDVGKGINGYEDLNNGKHRCYYRTPCFICGTTLSERSEDYDHTTSHTSDSEYEYGDFGSWSQTLAPTCVDKGELTRTRPMWNYPVYTCSFCSYSYTDKDTIQLGEDKETSEIKARGHDFGTDYVVDTPATCLQKGSKSQHCSRCLEKQDITEIPLADHTWNDGVITTKATCTTKGMKTFTCTVCGKMRTEEFESETTEHLYTWTITKQPTCTEKGEKTYTCSRCGDTYTEEIAATGHTSGGEIIDVGKGINGYQSKNDTQHTCYYITKCSVCQETLSTRQQDVNHSKSKNYTGTYTSYSASQHTKDYTEKCSYCSYSTSGSDSAVSHSWNSGTVTLAATCMSTGTMEYTCTASGCDKTKTETTDKTTHATYTFSSAVSAGTHKVGSSAEIRCRNCSYSYGGDEINPTHNTYMSLVGYKAATCTEYGRDFGSYYCSYCDSCYYRSTGGSSVTSKTSHSYTKKISDAVSAQYHVDGHKAEYQCSNCGTTDPNRDGSTIYRTHKNYETSYSYKAATCKAVGYQSNTIYCSSCRKYISGGEIAKTDHKWGNKVTNTAKYNNGYQAYGNWTDAHYWYWKKTCSICSSETMDYEKEACTFGSKTYTSYTSCSDTQHNAYFDHTCKYCERTVSSSETESHDLDSTYTYKNVYTDYFAEDDDSGSHKVTKTSKCSKCSYSGTSTYYEDCSKTGGTDSSWSYTSTNHWKNDWYKCTLCGGYDTQEHPWSYSAHTKCGGSISYNGRKYYCLTCATLYSSYQSKCTACTVCGYQS